MTLTQRLRVAVLTAALSGLAAPAADKVVPAGGAPRQAIGIPQAPAPVMPLLPCPPVPCPPGPSMPGQPGMAPVVPMYPTPGMPSAPGAPSAPGTPSTPTAPGTPGTPNTPATPNTPNTPPTPAADQSASAAAGRGGGEASATSLPGVFGDLFGGGAIRAPFLARFDAQGRVIGPAPRVIVNGQSQPLTGVNRATDELLFGRAAQAPAGAQVASTRIISNVDPRDAALLPLIPQFNRGAFKITENETPRPTTRAYLTYNFYDNLFKTQGVNTPRIMLHQENFGYEQAFCGEQFSVGLRLPYNQVVSPGYLNTTSLGDLTIVTKAVIAENRATGDLLSGGVSITAPTGSLPASGVSGVNVPRSTLIQPYLGYILVNGDWFLQGFSSVIVPTDSADITLFAQSLALGYTLFKQPGGTLSGIYPVFEAHLNTPLNHRNFGVDTVSFPDNLTLLGGTYFEFYSRSTLGFAAGAPVTGPRPFSLQATAQLSIRF